MKHYSFTEATHCPLSLQQIVDHLVSHCLPLAETHDSAVINEVGKGVFFKKGSESFIDLIYELISTVVANSRKGDIHISAQRKDKEIVLAIQERNNYNGYALSFSIGALMPDAFSIGGMLDIKCPQKKITTIYLSLPIKAAA